MYPTYGKDAERLTDALQMFNMCLYDYTADQIKPAFVSWMKGNKVFPTPSDIINLIERGNKPAFEQTVYLGLAKKRDKQPEMLDDDEWGYITDYEKYKISGQY